MDRRAMTTVVIHTDRKPAAVANKACLAGKEKEKSIGLLTILKSEGFYKRLSSFASPWQMFSTGSSKGFNKCPICLTRLHYRRASSHVNVCSAPVPWFSGGVMGKESSCLSLNRSSGGWKHFHAAAPDSIFSEFLFLAVCFISNSLLPFFFVFGE